MARTRKFEYQANNGRVYLLRAARVSGPEDRFGVEPDGHIPANWARSIRFNYVKEDVDVGNNIKKDVITYSIELIYTTSQDFDGVVEGDETTPGSIKGLALPTLSGGKWFAAKKHGELIASQTKSGV